MDTRVVRRRIEIEKDGEEELCHGPQVVEEMQQLSLFSTNATAQSTGGPQHAQPLKLHIHTAEGEERETASQPVKAASLAAHNFLFECAGLREFH